jgi:polyphosphate kinase 2 (PPK2 family)
MPRTRNGTHRKSVRELLGVRPRQGGIDMSPIDPSETNGVKRQHADEMAFADEKQIMSLQECLHAEGKRSVQIVLQGMDTSGKDGTIGHALQGLNPQGVRIVSFKAPTPNERRHDFLWRVNRQLPGRGEIVLTYPKPHLDVQALKVQIKAEA